MPENVRRSIAVATAALFFISLLFPAVAGFVKDTAKWPKWWGRLDVALAFAVVILVFVIQAVTHDRVDQQVKQTTYRAYRFLLNVVFLALVVFFIAGDRIIWTQCLTGLAWRYWLLLYALPWWLAAMRVTVE